MGGISEKDINLKTPTKLALVGFLSFYIAFKVKCIAAECRGTGKWPLDLSGLSCSWYVAPKAVSIHRTFGLYHAAGTNHQSP